MIEFEGTLSDECRKYLTTRSRKIIFYSTLIPCAVVCVALCVLAITYHYALFLGAAYAASIPALAPFLMDTKKDQERYIPRRIYIDIEDETIGAEGLKFHNQRGFSDIKNIIDYGDWYTVLFFFGSKDISFVIQKDLITQGTLEEFERLFEDKILPAAK